MKKTVYTLINESIEINARMLGVKSINSHTTLSEDEIRKCISFDSHDMRDYESKDEAIAACEKVCVSSRLTRWVTTLFSCTVSYVIEYEAEYDEDGDEIDREDCGDVIFRCEEIKGTDAEEEETDE